MQRTSIKRGATLQFDAALTNSDGPIDLTGWAITSQVRTPAGALIGDVAATVLDQSTHRGQYRLHASTAAWPPGMYAWDIAYAYSDGAGGQVVTYTEGVQLCVEAAITAVQP